MSTYIQFFGFSAKCEVPIDGENAWQYAANLKLAAAACENSFELASKRRYLLS